MDNIYEAAISLSAALNNAEATGFVLPEFVDNAWRDLTFAIEQEKQIGKLCEEA